MNWKLKDWQNLTVDELHAIYKLRTDVFVVEQGCAYPEVDEHDPASRHLMVWDEGELAGYARICPPHTVYPEPSLGRIVVHKGQRNKGLGKALINRCLADLKKNFPDSRVKIQAQEYLASFYAAFGFKTITKSYPDVMVMHVDMVLDLNQKSQSE
jgi:ElaA protein